MNFTKEQLELMLWATGNKQVERRIMQQEEKLHPKIWLALDQLDVKLNEQFAGRNAAEELKFLLEHPDAKA